MLTARIAFLAVRAVIACALAVGCAAKTDDSQPSAESNETEEKPNDDLEVFSDPCKLDPTAFGEFTAKNAGRSQVTLGTYQVFSDKLYCEHGYDAPQDADIYTAKPKACVATAGTTWGWAYPAAIDGTAVADVTADGATVRFINADCDGLIVTSLDPSKDDKVDGQVFLGLQCKIGSDGRFAECHALNDAKDPQMSYATFDVKEGGRLYCKASPNGNFSPVAGKDVPGGYFGRLANGDGCIHAASTKRNARSKTNDAYNTFRTGMLVHVAK